MKPILPHLLVLIVMLHERKAAAETTESSAAQAPALRQPEPPASYREATQPSFAEQQRRLSDLWVFASLNYLYCDVIGLMDAKVLKQYERGKVGGVTIDEKFLLAGTALIEVPLSMVFLSTALDPRASRIANIGAGALMSTVQVASLFVTRPTSYYLFSSVAEVATTSYIAVYALLYMKPPAITPSVEVKSGAFAMKVGFVF